MGLINWEALLTMALEFLKGYVSWYYLPSIGNSSISPCSCFCWHMQRMVFICCIVNARAESPNVRLRDAAKLHVIELTVRVATV